jgi:hypothetical protein
MARFDAGVLLFLAFFQFQSAWSTTLGPTYTLSCFECGRALAPASAVSLSEAPLGDPANRMAVARRYGQRLALDLSVSGADKEYERRARELANDKLDTLATTYRGPDGSTIKMHLVTGELLITDRAGKIVLFTRLPVGTREIFGFKDAGEVFRTLTENVETPPRYGRTWRHARLTVDENLGVTGFLGPVLAAQKYQKHVIQQRDFGDQFRSPREYEQAAKELANSTRRSAITVATIDTDRRGNPVPTLVKFDPMTDEVVVVNPVTRKIITYFKLNVRRANAYLRLNGARSTKDVFEYLLMRIRLGDDDEDSPR